MVEFVIWVHVCAVQAIPWVQTVVWLTVGAGSNRRKSQQGHNKVACLFQERCDIQTENMHGHEGRKSLVWATAAMLPIQLMNMVHVGWSWWHGPMSIFLGEVQTWDAVHHSGQMAWCL